MSRLAFFIGIGLVISFSACNSDSVVSSDSTTENDSATNNEVVVSSTDNCAYNPALDGWYASTFKQCTP